MQANPVPGRRIIHIVSDRTIGREANFGLGKKTGGYVPVEAPEMDGHSTMEEALLDHFGVVHDPDEGPLYF